MSNFDLIVIGGGPGGYVAAIKGAQLGLNTAIIEKDRFGGTCLNRGCIPTKAMLHAADLYREILEGGRFGIHAEKVTVNYGEVLDYKQETIDKLVSGVEQLLKANGVTMLKGTGTLLADRQVKVTFAEPAEDGATESYYDAEHIILAGGSYPAKLPVEGMELEGVLTSDGLFALKEIPESLTIIGGGVIGVEFAEVFSALGCKVTILEALPKLLANLDKEISENDPEKKRRGHPYRRIPCENREGSCRRTHLPLYGKRQGSVYIISVRAVRSGPKAKRCGIVPGSGGIC